MSEPDPPTGDHAGDASAGDASARSVDDGDGDERSSDDGSGIAHGVVDRIVEGLAVVLVGDDEHEFEVPVAELPRGVVESSVVMVRTTDGSLEVLGVDDAATAAARERAADQRDRLRGRSRRFGPGR